MLIILLHVSKIFLFVTSLSSLTICISVICVFCDCFRMRTFLFLSSQLITFITRINSLSFPPHFKETRFLWCGKYYWAQYKWSLARDFIITSLHLHPTFIALCWLLNLFPELSRHSWTEDHYNIKILEDMLSSASFLHSPCFRGFLFQLREFFFSIYKHICKELSKVTRCLSLLIFFSCRVLLHLETVVRNYHLIWYLCPALSTW